jgi:hypothetical protein
MPAVQRVLAITGIDTLMKIYPSVAASLAHPPGQNAQNATSSPADATAKAETDGDGT